MKPVEVGSQEASVVHGLLVRLVALAYRFPRVVLATALLASAAGLYASCTRLEYRTQRSDLASPRKDYQERWQRYVAEFGDDDDIVVVVQGGDRPRMRQALDHIAAQVEVHRAEFERLFYKVDLRHLRNRALLFLSTDEIRVIRDNIKSMRMLLDLGPLSWGSLTLAQLLHEAQSRLGRVQPGQPLAPSDHQFLTQLSSICRSATVTLKNAADYYNPWNSLLAQPPAQSNLLDEAQYFFSGDGSLAFLLAQPIKDSRSFTGARRSVEAMRSIVADARSAYPELAIGLTGMPVLETDEMVAAERDTRWASMLAVAGVTLLFFAVYRSPYYPLLTVATLLIGTSWALGWLTLTVGHLNLLSATFAVMLIGMGDYGVLWVMRYEQERSLGASVEAALGQTARCVGTGTLTAAATTALAFYAAMMADFQAVAELGWIAGSGVLLCALACFTVLPALLKIGDRRERSMPIALPHPTRTVWLPGLAGRSGWVIAASLALTAGLGAWACQLTYDHNLLHLQAAGLESVNWELTLIQHTAGASWHALNYTDSPEAARALKARYEKLPEVSRVVEVASLVPRDQGTKFDFLREIQQRLVWLPDGRSVIPRAVPPVPTLKKEISELMDRLKSLSETESPLLLGELQQNLLAFNQVLTPDRAEDLREFEEHVAGDLAADLRRLRSVSTPAPLTLDDLPPPLRERYIGRTGQWLVQAFAKDCLWDYQPLEHFVDQIQTVDPEATGKPFGTVEGLRAMKNGFERAGLYAFLAIVTVLLIDFRSLKRTLFALAPLVMGICLALGIMGFFGLPLNPANMIALPLILGVGVDNGVHVLHDYLAHKAEGQHRLSRAIGRGVLIKALTTMIGFGTLMISTQRGLVGLGFCLTLGVACCMLASLLFLPAVLWLWSSLSPTSTDASQIADRHRQAA
jgi:hopanoid biosynthesis associated RND transporter like protein HpnN